VKTFSEPESHPCSSLASIITGFVTNWTLNIYGMNSVDVFVSVKIHLKQYSNCVTHLCSSGTTSHNPGGSMS
jgi:hypothetical protein